MTKGAYRNTIEARDRAASRAADDALPPAIRDAHRILAHTYDVELANVETRRIARAIVQEHERKERAARAAAAEQGDV